MVLDHHFTHDDLEARLEYSQPNDLVWREAKRSEIPSEKHQNAIEMEETMARRVFGITRIVNKELITPLPGI